MKTYRVRAGMRRYLGHEPGARFDADLDPAQEARAVASGQIEVVGKGQESPDDVSLSMSRGELEEVARGAGVESPEQLPNKDAVVDAIKRARS